MPYFIFSNKKNIYEYLTEPGFKLLLFGQDPVNFDELQQINFRVPIFSFPEIPKHLFKKTTGFYILLRPDNHIVYIGKDPAACIDFLKKL